MRYDVIACVIRRKRSHERKAFKVCFRFIKGMFYPFEGDFTFFRREKQFLSEENLLPSEGK